LALSGGDDYELLFTAAPNKRKALQVLAADLGVPLTRIGLITPQPGLVFLDHGSPVPAEFGGYDHFSN
jgi:thiamine-monophosphate kinase